MKQRTAVFGWARYSSCSGTCKTRDRVRLKILVCTVIACLIVLSAAVSLSAGAQSSPSYRGRYIFGHEVRSFQPCNSEKVYWANADETLREKLKEYVQKLTDKPYEPIYVEVQGQLCGKAAEGFAADYYGQIFIERLDLVSRDVPGDCKEKGMGGDYRENSTAALTGLENAQWRLAEVSGSPVSPLAGEKQPHIMFDPAQRRVTGFTGCNNFFGGYELEGSALKFGPVGSTRMACPDLETGLETEVFKALDKTRGWEIREDTLLLLDGSNVLARFTTDYPDDPAVDLQSMTFLSSWLPPGKVTLCRGEYREPAAPNSAAEIVVTLSDKQVFGLINGRQTGAVVLVTEPGGSGTFYDLALLTKEDAGWVNTDALMLGDRVEVHAIEIAGDTIFIPMKTHGPGDPMCCPTLEVEKRFAIQGNRLVISAEGAKTGEPRIAGPVWQWVQTLYNNDSKAVPDDSKNYTVQFQEDGTLNVKADCNLKGGTYSTDGKLFSIDIPHSTMTACPENSLEDEFVRNLTAGAIFFWVDGDLYLDLKYDTGTMHFSKKREK